MTKVAVLVDPQTGWNADQEYEPGPSIEVRRQGDDQVVFTAGATSWNDGQVDPQAGDRGWWFDFSSVVDPGTYEIVDAQSGDRSRPFVIGPNVYDDVLDAALRMYWFNRANTQHPAEYAGAWAGPATLLGEWQDGAARWVDEPNDDTARDLHGGWYDAGDTNKYVTFAASAVHQLLSAYETNPSVFDDAVGIPDSGNGVPDLLDEVRWELEWLERMQDPDGGVLVKVGFIKWIDNPPIEVEQRPRYYEEACSSSTVAAAAMFAHGARVFESIDAAWSAELQGRAIDALNWYRASERRNDCDPQIVHSGDADLSFEEQDQAEFVAAVHLFAQTGDEQWHATIRDRLDITNPFRDAGFGRYEPEQADAIALYRSLDAADPQVVARIDERLKTLLGTTAVHGFDPSNSLYRSFMPDPQYHWGSNMVMANSGNANLAMIDLGVAPPRDAEFTERSEAHLATLHGVNPLGLVYLSNMADFGAERSVNEMFHFWFVDGSHYDHATDSAAGPAPGYLVGGPNANYGGTATPPIGEPPSKSYLDWNTDSLEARSWEITEPAIYYQSAYIRLLAGIIDQ